MRFATSCLLKVRWRMDWNIPVNRLENWEMEILRNRIMTSTGKLVNSLFFTIQT